jgi:hypothetical protein
LNLLVIASLLTSVVLFKARVPSITSGLAQFYDDLSRICGVAGSDYETISGSLDTSFRIQQIIASFSNAEFARDQHYDNSHEGGMGCGEWGDVWLNQMKSSALLIGNPGRGGPEWKQVPENCV